MAGGPATVPQANPFLEGKAASSPPQSTSKGNATKNHLGRKDSNLEPSDPESDVLPVAPRPNCHRHGGLPVNRRTRLPIDVLFWRGSAALSSRKRAYPGPMTGGCSGNDRAGGEEKTEGRRDKATERLGKGLHQPDARARVLYTSPTREQGFFIPARRASKGTSSARSSLPRSPRRSPAEPGRGGQAREHCQPAAVYPPWRASKG